ncbi:FmdB family transcriptional regulator [Brachybacterium ginsengisoli]|uniref:FmdB family transcriptional regulator n=1 Tax=Brachybacterium ginsengisoli TaxID=1331682 RepID=A0A291GY27_9MICO|nr:FmdB family zinc ribbon protein [Brachybacterium ginsengisoli]ATG55117.1 FmdB family transcriptional regulator [Brachybacterium ginsengisoli]
MPTYVYACKNCGHRFEQYQSFSEDSLLTCPECTQDTLRKVFDSVGIVFKGPGFYSTDSATSGASTSSSSSSSSQAGSSSESAAPASTGAGASDSSSSSTASSSSQPAAAAS